MHFFPNFIRLACAGAGIAHQCSQVWGCGMSDNRARCSFCPEKSASFCSCVSKNSPRPREGGISPGEPSLSWGYSSCFWADRLCWVLFSGIAVGKAGAWRERLCLSKRQRGWLSICRIQARSGTWVRRRWHYRTCPLLFPLQLWKLLVAFGAFLIERFWLCKLEPDLQGLLSLSVKPWFAL